MTTIREWLDEDPLAQQHINDNNWDLFASRLLGHVRAAFMWWTPDDVSFIGTVLEEVSEKWRVEVVEAADIEIIDTIRKVVQQ